jgi:hypothetical protein
MTAGGAAAAGPDHRLRIDPLTLPMRFRVADAAADGHLRIVELHREMVVLRSSVRPETRDHRPGLE